MINLNEIIQELKAQFNLERFEFFLYDPYRICFEIKQKKIEAKRYLAYHELVKMGAYNIKLYFFRLICKLNKFIEELEGV